MKAFNDSPPVPPNLVSSSTGKSAVLWELSVSVSELNCISNSVHVCCRGFLSYVVYFRSFALG